MLSQIAGIHGVKNAWCQNKYCLLVLHWIMALHWCWCQRNF